MATLITGGAGFIGSRLAARLLAMNETVVILDNFNDYYDPVLKRANVAALGEGAAVVEGDIRDEACVERLFQRHPITRVVHFAAMPGPRNSVDKARLYADVNTTGSVTMMEAARRHQVEVFIQASTSSVYGYAQHIPFHEDDAPDFPLTPYPASKRAAEIFAYSHHHLFGLNVTVLRFFNVYGPGGRPDMMPMRVMRAILEEEPITVYDSGTLQRDWTYIDDTIDGIIAALEHPMGYRIINLGCGAPIALTDFIHIFEQLIGQPAVTIPVPTPASEPLITYCDNSRAKELLGFDPRVEIEEGLARTWAWYHTSHKL